MAIRPHKFRGHTQILEVPPHIKQARIVPAWTDGESVVSCWKISLWDRVKLLFHGNIWLWMQTGKSMPPVFIECEKEIFEIALKTHKDPE
jgi:hypothetical protein